MYTRIPYRYVDEANYKAHGDIILDGLLSEADVEAIRSKLSDREYFIPADLNLGIEEMQSQLSSFPSSWDHVYHILDLDDLEQERVVEEGASTIPARDFVAAFTSIAHSEAWDEASAMERLGL